MQVLFRYLPADRMGPSLGPPHRGVVVLAGSKVGRKVVSDKRLELFRRLPRRYHRDGWCLQSAKGVLRRQGKLPCVGAILSIEHYPEAATVVQRHIDLAIREGQERPAPTRWIGASPPPMGGMPMGGMPAMGMAPPMMGAHPTTPPPEFCAKF